MSPRRLLFSRSCLAVLGLVFASSALAQATTPAASQPAFRFVTSLGSFTIELDAARAPLSAANIMQYVRDGHYNGTIFHRVIGNFMVQAGGFGSDLKEKPTRAGVPNESGNGLSNRRGTVAMARTDDPHSATSQFFVNVVDNHALDPSPSRWGYAVIGRVVEGMDTVDKIASVATGQVGPFPEDAPMQAVVVESAQIVGDPVAAAQ